ncbi:MAG: hypothetical protein M1833_005885 [Piccolia ochrophora]|nr:MAG: hypothetical protein M1833_005885 [Piccolia ochrophora]
MNSGDKPVSDPPKALVPKRFDPETGSQIIDITAEVPKKKEEEGVEPKEDGKNEEGREKKEDKAKSEAEAEKKKKELTAAVERFAEISKALGGAKNAKAFFDVYGTDGFAQDRKK